MIQGEAGFMKQLKLWMLLVCFALGFDSSEGKKCCVSRAYAVCWVTPNFWENALTDEKKKKKKEIADYVSNRQILYFLGRRLFFSTIRTIQES